MPIKAHPISKFVVLATLWLAVTAGLLGCDDEVADHVPAGHAEVRATYLAQMTVVDAQEMILLHPQSDRQRHARKQLLALESLDERVAEMGRDKEREERQTDQALGIEERLETLQRWTQLVDDADLDDPQQPEEAP